MTVSSAFSIQAIVDGKDGSDGMPGGYTDIRFALSRYDIPRSESQGDASLDGAPADIDDTTSWYASVPVAEAQKPFLWMRSVRYEYVLQDDEYVAVAQSYTYTCLTAQGTLRADFDDEMTAVPCDSAGTPDSQWRWTTSARLWYGLEAERLTGAAVTASTGIGLTPLVVISDDGLSAAVTFTAGNITGDTATIVLTLTSQRGSRQCTARVVKVRGGADGSPATVYGLVVSENALKRTASGFVPSRLTVNVRKTQGGDTSLLTTWDAVNAEGLKLSYRKDDADVSTPISASNQQLTLAFNAGTALESKLTLELWQTGAAGDVLMDVETVPVLRDGAKGDDAVLWQLRADTDVLREDTAAVTGLYVTKSVGGSSPQLYSSASALSLDGLSVVIVGAGTQGHPFYNAVVEYDSHRIDLSEISHPLIDGDTLTVAVLKDGTSEVARKSWTVVARGQQGRMGKSYYYAGEWAAGQVFPQPPQYPVTEWLTPYVSLTNAQTGAVAYWLLVADTNRDGANVIAPSAQATGVWEPMQSEMRFLITEALFTNFARLAKAVFSGDMMLSQYGRPPFENFESVPLQDNQGRTGYLTNSDGDTIYPAAVELAALFGIAENDISDGWLDDIRTLLESRETGFTQYGKTLPSAFGGQKAWVPNLALDLLSGTITARHGVFSGQLRRERLVINSGNWRDSIVAGEDPVTGQTIYTLNIDDVGTWLELDASLPSLGIVHLLLPSLPTDAYADDPEPQRGEGQTDAQWQAVLDEYQRECAERARQYAEYAHNARSYVGARLIIYNRHGSITLRYSNPFSKEEREVYVGGTTWQKTVVSVNEYYDVGGGQYATFDCRAGRCTVKHRTTLGIITSEAVYWECRTGNCADSDAVRNGIYTETSLEK